MSVADIAPTLLDVAGVDASRTEVAGRAVRPITGRLWAPWLCDSAARLYGAEDGISTELFGSRPSCSGDWKFTYIGDGVWRLFDIVRDPGKTRDLSLAVRQITR